MELSLVSNFKTFQSPPKKSHIRYPLALVSISLLHWPLSTTNLPPLYRFVSSEHFIQREMYDKWLSLSGFSHGLERAQGANQGAKVVLAPTTSTRIPRWCPAGVLMHLGGKPQVELKSSKDWPLTQKWLSEFERVYFKPEETKLLILADLSFLLPFSWGNREAPKQNEISYGK